MPSTLKAIAATRAAIVAETALCLQYVQSLVHLCKFGKIGRIASEEVIFALIKSKCRPILLYGSDSCPTNAAVKHSFEFTLNRVLFKIFGALPKDTYRDICNILV